MSPALAKVAASAMSGRHYSLIVQHAYIIPPMSYIGVLASIVKLSRGFYNEQNRLFCRTFLAVEGAIFSFLTRAFFDFRQREVWQKLCSLSVLALCATNNAHRYDDGHGDKRFANTEKRTAGNPTVLYPVLVSHPDMCPVSYR